MMMNDDVTIDPWGSSQSTDYSRIIEKFGLSSMDGVSLDGWPQYIGEDNQRYSSQTAQNSLVIAVLLAIINVIFTYLFY